jgi:glycosyltransferase involved in cell wall biosynthesis
MIYKSKISLVIPVFNNADSLRELSKRLIDTLKKCSHDYEILYINDSSQDNSLEILKDLAAKIFAIKIVNLSRNFGQHPAICAGFEHVTGDVVILMDADLQDRPEDIMDILQKLHSENVDIVYTIKKSLEKRQGLKVTSIIYHYVFAKLIKTNVPLNIGTFRVFNRKFLEAILQFKEVNVLYGPLMFYVGFKSSFIELPYLERIHGKSSYTFRKRLQLAVSSLISYTDLPHRFSTAFGLILLFSSLMYGLLVFLNYFFFGRTLPSGTTIIILLLCLALGSLMMSLGIIGTYVFRSYQEVLQRPRYLIQDKINL